MSGGRKTAAAPIRPNPPTDKHAEPSPIRFGDFSQQAEIYAHARPGYPDTLIDTLIDEAAVTEGDPVADIGAGTGLFTQALADRNLKVTAVEPNDLMTRQADDRPNVQWHNGSFESTGLPAASQKWVTAAQAFHWADPKIALAEMRRILQPAGRFTVLWNNRDPAASDVLAWTQAIISRIIPDFDAHYREGYSGVDWADVLLSTGHFQDVAGHEACHVVPMSRQRYLNLWRSHNRLNVTAGPQRFAAFLGEVEQRLDRQGIDHIDVPYVCTAWSAGC